MSVRVRFAPSPTGFLHVGGARTALFNWLFARHHGGAMVLRVEDTDVARERPEYREAITKAFEWLGIDFDEGPGKGGPFGPYTQRERIPMYQAKARELLERELVYPCFCTPKDEDVTAQDDEPEQTSNAARCQCRYLSAPERAEKSQALQGEMPALRFAVDQSRSYALDDMVRGHVVYPPGQVEDFIITKQGLQPLYNFAAVIDDHAMEITHVIRGEEHLANTPKQNVLYDAFGWAPPAYAHIPIILNMEGKKLSKRDGATSVADFQRLGYLPEALLNFIALLGWSPGDDREIMSRQDLIAAFDINPKRVQKSGAKFDTEKLAWMNGEYLKKAPLDELVEGTRVILALQPNAATLRTDRAHVAAVCDLLRERAKTLAELVEANRFFFEPGSIVPDPEAVTKRAGTPEAFERLALVRERLEAAQTWDAATLETAIRGLADERNGKAGEYIHPLRVAVTGHAVSPGIFQTLVVLGRDVSLLRVAEFLDHREALRA